MTSRRTLATIFVALGLLIPAAPAAAGDEPISTEKPSTDSEGVGGKENTGETETAEGGEGSGGIQTWGGGPKSGELSPEWEKWLLDVLRDPKNPPAYPKDDGRPKDPQACVTAINNWEESKKDPNRDGKLDIQFWCSY